MNVPEFITGLLEGGKPRVVLAYDGEEPQEVEFESMGLSICLDGHLHGIAIGDAEAVRIAKDELLEVDEPLDGAPLVHLDPAQAAQFIEQLAEAGPDADIDALLSQVAPDLDLGALRAAAIREMERLGEGMPPHFREHTARLAEMSQDPSVAPDELLKMHIRLFADPRFVREMREGGHYDPVPDHDSLLEAYLDGKDVSNFAGFELLEERPDLVEQVIEELEAEGVL